MEQNELGLLRDQLDDIDDAILRLFLRRMDTIEAVAEYKRRYDLPVLDAGREERILARVRQSAGNTYADASERLFRLLLTLSRESQGRRR